MSDYVLDACALIAYLNGEPGQEKVLAVLEAAEQGTATVRMHRLNFYEVYYDAYRSGGPAVAEQFWVDVSQLPIDFVDILSETLLKEAAYFKVNYKISLADSIALGLTILHQAEVVTSDHHEFDRIEQNEPLRFLWIR